MRTRSPWIVVTAAVTALVGAGVGLIFVSAAGEANRDIGVSMASGGITSLFLVIAGAVLAKRDEVQRLLMQLSAAQDLTAVNLHGRKIDDLALVGMKMAVADLSETTLCRARLVDADLRWATLRDSVLPDCVFAYACMEDVDLTRAKLERANLQHVKLARANFSGALLRLADLRGADLCLSENLHAATLESIVYDETTKWPLGFDPPPSDSRALEALPPQPPWDDYWSRHGHNWESNER